MKRKKFLQSSPHVVCEMCGKPFEHSTPKNKTSKKRFCDVCLRAKRCVTRKRWAVKQKEILKGGGKNV